MGVYLDASVILPMLVEEAASPAVDAFIARHPTGLVLSSFAAAEVASVLSRLVRTGQLETADARDRLADLDAWQALATEDVDVQPSDIRLAGLHVRRFELMLRAPDAVHLAICRRTDHVLATLDRRLAAAALAVGVPVDPIAP